MRHFFGIFFEIFVFSKIFLEKSILKFFFKIFFLGICSSQISQRFFNSDRLDKKEFLITLPNLVRPVVYIIEFGTFEFCLWFIRSCCCVCLLLSDGDQEKRTNRRNKTISFEMAQDEKQLYGVHISSTCIIRYFSLSLITITTMLRCCHEIGEKDKKLLHHALFDLYYIGFSV